MSRSARWWRIWRAMKLPRTTFAFSSLRPAFARPISRQRSPPTQDVAVDPHRPAQTRAAIATQRRRRAVRQAAAAAQAKRSLWQLRDWGTKMPKLAYNVLFLCTGNSARSIIAEAILNRIGAGKFKAYSAGSQPKGRVNPHAVQLLKSLGYDTSAYRSKSWSVFAQPAAPKFDFVFTVCDNAAGEACPVWPGQPMTAHWGIEDPAAVEGTDMEKEAAFVAAFRYLKNRITAFTSLPLEGIDRLSLGTKLRDIGRTDGSSSGQEKAS